VNAVKEVVASTARHRVPIAAALFVGLLPGRHATGQQTTPTPVADFDQRHAIAAAVSRLIEGAIPLEYDKQKDWGVTTELRLLGAEGKGLRTRLKIRKHAVNHGLWKHYKLRLVEPRDNLHVRLSELRPRDGGAEFQLQVDAKLDGWARAKLYQYGVHVIALEVEFDLRVSLSLGAELTIEMQTGAGGPVISLRPRVTSAHLTLDEFHLRRVSNAHGPIVRELGEEIPKLIADELNGPKLVDKLNRAIEKKRDRLSFRPGDLMPAWSWPQPGSPSTSAEVLP
jgi:hypothetical protein